MRRSRARPRRRPRRVRGRRGRGAAGAEERGVGEELGVGRAAADGRLSSSDDDEEAPPPPPKPAPKAKRRPKKPRQSEAEECADDGWKNFAHELLPKMNLTALKKMLATLKPLAKDAYKAAWPRARRQGRGGRAEGVRALFEHIPRDAILDACTPARRRNEAQLP